MGLKIYWTDFFKNELHKIFGYNKETTSLRTDRNFVLQINQSALKLQKQIPAIID